MLAVKQGTVHRWMARGLLPAPDGFVSGAPAWRWSTVSTWADQTGRSPQVRDHVLAILAASPGSGNFATPITRALTQMKVVGPETSPARIASVLTELLEEGLVSLHLRNEWRLTTKGRAAIEELPESTDLAHMRDLYQATKALGDREPVGYHTEKRHRSLLQLYVQALIEADELPSIETQRLSAAVEILKAAEAVKWSPSAVALVEAAYSNLQQLVDTVEAPTPRHL